MGINSRAYPVVAAPTAQAITIIITNNNNNNTIIITNT